jgi:hypothetical protein
VGALTGEDLAEIAFHLKNAGLAFDHVRQRFEWNDAAVEVRCREAVAGYITPIVKSRGHDPPA